MDFKVLNDVISKFKIKLGNYSFKQISQGYINDTYLVSIDGLPTYLLQRINSNVFKDVEGLHKNIIQVLHKLKADDYKKIELFPTLDDNPYLLENDNCWRIQNFVNDSSAHNFTSNKKTVFEAGRIIGSFHQLLANEVSNDYVETVKDLNYLPFRIWEFREALKNTSQDLKEKALSQIEFGLSNLNLFDGFYNANLPLRVCHNDTKLNNLLFDQDNNGLCLIDLDTIMPGYFHYDFGDTVRTVVSESNEDEKELERIKFNLSLFENFIDGLLKSKLKLSNEEISFLPISCALMPFMHGLRALTDFLNRNIYYKVTYPDQNLDRCKSLFRFAFLALQKQEEIKGIIENKL